ncbi:hypothetical protein GCM10023189_21370 [Nibrella saemangeumensis]|uniref:FAD linked oxidase N-terminal domain-containing protein n=1 Tax=Nibrella saemangeumensis TaxID=1084526 RepID=A0ABP8MR16_9BACT
MALPNGLEQKPMPNWTNGHENFTQPLKPNASFKLRIPNLSSPQAQYRQTTANFQWLIQHAIDNNLRMRALGKGWSFSDVAATDGGLVDTLALRQSFALRDSFVDPAYRAAGKSTGNLYFTECGMSIIKLEQILEPAGKSIRASGASNAQTIAGALSTGTHGGAFRFGAVHDSVVGLHLVTAPDRHVWLERASNPVAAPEFTDWLGVTEVYRDDDLFNSAVVSFGSFGFIHGVLLEIENLFLLEDYSTQKVPYTSALKKAMTDQDLTGLLPWLPLPVNDPTKEPYHLGVVVNPHQFDPTGADLNRGAYVQVRYKTPYRPNYPRPQPKPSGFTYGDDTLGLIQTVLDKMGRLALKHIPKLVNQLYPLAFEDTNGTAGTISEVFGSTNIRGKAVSAAIGVDSHDTPRVLEEIVKLNQQVAFPGLLGMRFVKGTPATLGFTRFPVTCVMELDGVQAKVTNEFLQRLWNRLEALRIPYTLHWGKTNFNLSESLVLQMYGQANVETWLRSRQKLLDAPARAVFTNAFMERCGLGKELMPAQPVPPVIV